MKKKQKIKAIRQPPFAPLFLSGMVVRTELPIPAALLPMYDKLKGDDFSSAYMLAQMHNKHLPPSFAWQAKKVSSNLISYKM